MTSAEVLCSIEYRLVDTLKESFNLKTYHESCQHLQNCPHCKEMSQSFILCIRIM